MQNLDKIEGANPNLTRKIVINVGQNGGFSVAVGVGATGGGGGLMRQGEQYYYSTFREVREWLSSLELD